MQSTMTDNSVGNIVYDSGHDTLNGRKRIGISATEIELLDDLPLTPGSGLTSPRNNVSDRTRGFSTQIPPSSSSNAKQKQQTTYQTLSLNREQFKPNVIYQDENNEQLNFAVDQLLEKYAPDAIPQNLLNTTNNRQAPAQVNVITARDQPPVSTFQTTTQPPPSSSSTITHNYSTIIRPNTGQTSQTQKQPQINNNNNNNNNNSSIGNAQTSTRSQPVANYDSFQHVIPPTQQQQQQRQPQQQPQQQYQQQQQQPQPQQQQQKQQQFQKTIPIKTKSGQVAQVVPGKLYNFDDDPLHLLYDRQITAPSNPPKPIFNTTFQPSNNFQTMSNPSTVIYTNTTQRFPQQSIPTTTNPNSNGIEPFNLGNLIKRVQQEYQREIQPFVSSVRFVEKDREYGQSLADVGFITPVTVRKGFSRQADDILRQSFGRQEHSRSPTQHRSEDNTYSEDDDDDDEDDDISDLRPKNHQHRLEKFDSKQSFTSVTSVSTTTSSDNDDRYTKLRNRTDPVEVHNQETSPPPQVNQTQPQTQVPKISVTAVDVSPKPVAKNETDDDIEEEETTTPVSTAPIPVTPAKRIPSDQRSDTSSGSTISDDEENRPAAYNEHELPPDSQPKPTDRVQALATITPVVKPDDATRERLSNIANQATQRSEDIHPTPPIIRPTQTSNNRTQIKTDTEESDGIPSGSDNVSDSDDEERSATYNEQPQAPSTARPTAPQNTFSTPTTRGPTTQQTSARLPATTTTQNQFSTSRTTTDNNTRQAAGAGTAPNIHFVPPDQRSGINDRGGPATSTNQPTVDAAQTGSNRFFQSDNNPKPGAKRSTKDGPASIGDKLKSFFRRK